MHLDSLLAAVLVIPACILLMVLTEKVVKFLGSTLRRAVVMHSRHVQMTKKRKQVARLNAAKHRAQLSAKHMRYEYLVVPVTSSDNKAA